MIAKIYISKWDNFLAVPIPASIAESLKLKPDDTVFCSIENGKIVLQPVPRTLEYTLDELLAGVIEPSEEVSWGKPEGEEVW